MEFIESMLPGVGILQSRVMADARGAFVKTFHQDMFEGLGLRTDWKEEYFSHSVAGVVRGMHFQLPPHDHAKLVFCLAGEVLDVVLDLRTDSPTFGKCASFELTGDNGQGVYMPPGCAHGFVSRSDLSTLYYKVTSVYAPSADAGIAWDSFGFDWGVDAPLLSERDQRHPRFGDFDSPFRLQEAVHGN
ncbi:dTDP-4-dehydrorhamnose 3,5-epimerase [Sphingomonas sp.]|uniref:dTDP-4-dehydrorhamnose 3,5-epimerase n=1 Tax=Sphingomonas sp. TaxID=28214 RepID=UPI002EDA3087